jgi:hypothetical protein
MRWLSHESRRPWCSVVSAAIPLGKNESSNAVGFGGLLPLTHSEGNSMLRINFSETPAEERWILHGQLADPWATELRACWKKNHRTDVQRACIVDLDEITFVDKNGEQVLRLLAGDGARFTASGIYTNYILEKIASNSAINRSAPEIVGGETHLREDRSDARCECQDRSR